ncbi:MAG: hypothetical protein JXD22_17335 [Sedimentisphaerales bacterium]|nr:hypothetical protein [Sedimentisphaerales bacterium]
MDSPTKGVRVFQRNIFLKSPTCCDQRQHGEWTCRDADGRGGQIQESYENTSQIARQMLPGLL